MDLLENQEHQPQILWHGTCADFDTFYPLSQFAIDKRIADSSQFQRGIRQPPKERFHSDYNQKALQHDIETFRRLRTDLFTKKLPPKKDPNFKIIPVHLQMQNPLALSCIGFDLDPGWEGVVWGLLFKNKKVPLEPHDLSTAMGDFIFKDIKHAPLSAVCHELELGHLYPVEKNEEDNRYHLSVQRFIFFLESMGYDGLVYDYTRDAVDAYRMGKIADFDNRAYVIFHPDQVIRLDKKVDIPVLRPNKQEKIELNKIFYQYQKSHHPSKMENDKIVKRLELCGCIKNKMSRA